MSDNSTYIQQIEPNASKEGGGQIVLYQPDESISLEVKLDVDADTVWLNRQQISELFGRDIKTIGKHINNALREELLYDAEYGNKNQVVAKFATTAADGKTYQVDYYCLDVIISVGYRVKSTRGVQFRRWATNVLRDHLLQGYSINRQLVAMQERTDERFMQIEQQLNRQQTQVEFLVDMHRPSTERIFPTGCVFDAWEYVSSLIRSAKSKVILIDNYCDERTLTLLQKRPDGVDCTIHTRYTESFKADLTKHNHQYSEIRMVQLPHKAHDRFLIVDDDVYILGDSIKDLGHSLTTVLKTGFTPNEILCRLV